MWDLVRTNRPIRLSDIPRVENLIRPSDGYVDVKKLCSLGRRYVWRALGSANSFAIALEAEVKKPVIVKSDDLRTWVHPRLADFIALSGNVDFAVAATRWMQVAREWSGAVESERTHLLHRVAEENSRQRREHSVRDKLHLDVGGRKEVALPGLICDIVTDSTVIEIKHARCLVEAASAIGQVSMYQAWFPTKAKRVHLFGTMHEIDACRKSSSLGQLALHNSVEVTYEVDET